MTETQIVKVCIEYLNWRGHFVWRNNTGATSNVYIDRMGNTRTRFWKAGIPGSSDILGIARDGRMIAVECKKPGNKPTEAQNVFLGEVRKRNGYAIVAFGVSELETGGL